MMKWLLPDGLIMTKKKNCTNVMVTTLGCKVNQFESESLNAQLKKLNFQTNPVNELNDICIINTCAVTGKASMQSRQAIRKAVRDNPNAVIIATGCYAQSEPDELKKIKGIDYIIGNSDKHRITQILGDIKEAKKTSFPVIIHNNILNQREIPKTIAPIVENRTRPFIKIQDGCNNFCSYCIVPYTRGPSRSTSLDEVLKIIHNLPINKRKEIVLTGIHLGRYGLDLSPPTSLLILLKRIQQENLVDRIRLSSLEPVEVTDNLLEFIAESGCICKHFHIPLQSGDKYILNKMNRPYNPDFFKRLIEKIHQTLPDAAIGVDILAGFPGESEEAFDNTYNLIASLPISYLHVFPYSSRPGTKAAALPGHIDPHIIKKRRNELLNLGRNKKSEFYTKMIGKSLDVLIEEKRDAASGQLTGVSSNYVRVLIDGEDNLKNKILPCSITKILNPNTVLGKTCSD
jgi:threonylcarbamoyladenosine tRNA methylthiotransferase MtaB